MGRGGPGVELFPDPLERFGALHPDEFAAARLGCLPVHTHETAIGVAARHSPFSLFDRPKLCRKCKRLPGVTLYPVTEHLISRRALLGVAAGTAIVPSVPAMALSAGLPFVLVGDWGRRGAKKQREVGAQMGVTAAEMGSRFVISMGDNFYEDGVSGLDDPQWSGSFESIYHAPSLQTPWHVILGNHDYQGNVEAQIAYSARSKRWNMPARYFMTSETLPDGSGVDFFYLDTNPFISAYHGTKVAIGGQDIVAQLAWLDAALGRSQAKWKILIGHHPLYTVSGGKSDQPEMIAAIKPLMQKHRVFIYINGHQHNFQYLQVDGMHFITNGAGSKTKRPKHAQPGQFASDSHGFMAVNLTSERFAFRFVDDAVVCVYRGQTKERRRLDLEAELISAVAPAPPLVLYILPFARLNTARSIHPKRARDVTRLTLKQAVVGYRFAILPRKKIVSNRYGLGCGSSRFIYKQDERRRDDMNPPRWTAGSQSSFERERESLEFSNSEFIDDEGRSITTDKPLPLANRKAKRLASVLNHADLRGGVRGPRAPKVRIEPLIFLSGVRQKPALDQGTEKRGALRGSPGNPEDVGVIGQLLRAGQLGFDRRGSIDAAASRQVVRAVAQAGTRLPGRGRRPPASNGGFASIPMPELHLPTRVTA
eukprot:gene2184-2221_t